VIHQYKTEFLIYAPGRCGSTQIANRPEFQQICHINHFQPGPDLPDKMYIVTREPEARLISALYQMYSKLYDTEGDWRNRIEAINEYTDHHTTDRIHDWGLPQYISATDRIHCQNYITELKQLSNTWDLNTIWVDLSELDKVLAQYEIPATERHGVPDSKRPDYTEFATALRHSTGWGAWQNYIQPEQTAWQSVVGRAFG